ncbi:GNAT family N-acetyltransferase [Nocardioides sambongensis]|uniref:GNAT family N-acetyltransferase n=1 Tax=Nocardioides sambongensis TaxID=2589074 RepID=UPI00112E51CD|nr:GNAT family N-acetyltransferase [Nocardioides sambongensis]
MKPRGRPDERRHPEVTHAPERSRYEAHLGGELAGFAEYQLAKDLIVFTHTEVDPAYEGKGVGGALARAALDDVRSAGDRAVMPLCPFIKSWIERHPDYADLVYGS